MASMRSLLKILIISMNLRMCFGQTVLVTGVDVIVTSTDSPSAATSASSYSGGFLTLSTDDEGNLVTSFDDNLRNIIFEIGQSNPPGSARNDLIQAAIFNAAPTVEKKGVESGLFLTAALVAVISTFVDRYLVDSQPPPFKITYPLKNAPLPPNPSFMIVKTNSADPGYSVAVVDEPGAVTVTNTASTATSSACPTPYPCDQPDCLGEFPINLCVVTGPKQYCPCNAVVNEINALTLDVPLMQSYQSLINLLSTMTASLSAATIPTSASAVATSSTMTASPAPAPTNCIGSNSPLSETAAIMNFYISVYCEAMANTKQKITRTWPGGCTMKMSNTQAILAGVTLDTSNEYCASLISQNDGVDFSLDDCKTGMAVDVNGCDTDTTATKHGGWTSINCIKYQYQAATPQQAAVCQDIPSCPTNNACCGPNTPGGCIL